MADENSSKDPVGFWLNILYIGLSSAVSISTGYFIYRSTLEQMRKVDQDGGRMEGELAAEAFENGGLMGDYSDEEVDEPLTTRSDPSRPIGLSRRISSGSDIV